MLFTTKQELNVSFNRELFRQELRQLIDRYIGASSSFKDHIEIFEELEREQQRLGAEGDKVGGFSLSPEEMDEVEREMIDGAETQRVLINQTLVWALQMSAHPSTAAQQRTSLEVADGPKHKVAVLQPAAREQEPRGR